MSARLSSILQNTPIVLLLAIAGCSGDGGGAAPLPSEPSGYRTDLIGSIQLLEYDDAGGNAHAFFFLDQAVPRERLQTTQGECAIYTHEPSVGPCASPCDGYCDTEGTCLPMPGRANVGRIQVSGLLTELSLIPGDFGYEAEPYPQGELFAAGATITATAAGGDIPAFTITGKGVADLSDQIPYLVLEDGQDKTITWTPAEPAEDDVRIQLALRFGWHGAPYEAMLLCESADDGELVIPGNLITQLPPYGVGLLPHPSELIRLVRNVVETEMGPIELVVGSRRVVSFEH